MDNIKQALINIGFSEVEAEKQLRELNDVIMALVGKRLLGEDMNPNMSENDVKALIEQSYSPDEFKKTFEEVSVSTLGGYLEAVSANLDPDRKDSFYLRSINLIASQLNSNQAI